MSQSIIDFPTVTIALSRPSDSLALETALRVELAKPLDLTVNTMVGVWMRRDTYSSHLIQSDRRPSSLTGFVMGAFFDWHWVETRR